jgi:hypothetical protein
MATGLFTALFNALSDPKSYYAMQKEMNLKAVAQTFFNSLAGKTVFEAVILPEDIGKPIIFDGQRAVRVRPLDIYDLIIPEPCDFEDVETRKRLLSLHPIAYPDINTPKIDATDAETDVNINDARVVECFFRDGPQSSGRLRGLTYRPRSVRSLSARHGINYECLYVGSTLDAKTATTKKPSSAQIAFKRGDYKPYEPTTETSSGVLKNLRAEQAKYVKESTEENIGTYKTSDGKTHYPIKKVYKGSVGTYKGKKLSNGLLPQELVMQSSSTTGYPALLLRDVINDFDRLAQAFEQRFNKKLQLTDSYRTFNRQIEMKNKKLKEAESISDPEAASKKRTEAAKPGTSNHGWGLAFDFNTVHDGKKGFESETYQWMLENAPRFGFESPETLRDGKGTEEAWHIQWIKINEIWG